MDEIWNRRPVVKTESNGSILIAVDMISKLSVSVTGDSFY